MGTFPPDKGQTGLPGASGGLSWRSGAIAPYTGAGGALVGVLRWEGTRHQAMTKKELCKLLEKIPDDKLVFVTGEGVLEHLILDEGGDVLLMGGDD